MSPATSNEFGPDRTDCLNTTAPSNFAYIDRVDLLETLPRVCTVPEVENELRSGVESHPYLQRALDSLEETILVVELDESTQERASELRARLDAGEAEAFAVADRHDGTLVTDDGPARALARESGVAVTGSIGVLIRSIDEGRISESHADGWLKRWIDETAYRAPSRDLEDYL